MLRRRAHVTEQVATWFRDRASPFLEEHLADRIAPLKEQLQRVERLANPADEDVAICFLGAAGVGKSTLLNALVSERHNVLPHGGIGALTAQATVVRYAEQPYLRAVYFGPKILQGILLTLEKAHLRTIQRAEDEANELARDLDAEQLAQVEAALPANGEAAGSDGTTGLVGAYEQQVRLMVQGSPRSSAELPYLLDCLRLIVGYAARWGTSPLPEDKGRIDRLREAVRATEGQAPHREVTASDDLTSYLNELRDHASGFLAPIIKHLDVGWNSDLLKRGVVLVDLPGVGVTTDEYRRVTAEWIRTKARAIVLVVNQRGVRDAEADLLRKTGFLNRLLHDGDATSTDPVTLALIMTHVDDAATTAWRDDRAMNGSNAKKWSQYFQHSRDEGLALLQSSLHQELRKLVAEGAESTRREREAALAQVEATVQAYAVSAPEYRLFHCNDEDDRPHIRSEDESGVPSLVAGLAELAERHRDRCEQAWHTALDGFAERIRSSLELVRALWQEQGAIAEREAAALKAELEEFLGPLHKELETRQGGFREFLRNSIPEQIEARVGEATLMARGDINKYLRRLGDLHWATLRATVRRGGAWLSSTGKHVDLPNELTLRFEEPVAVVWSRSILSALRKRTGELGDDYVKLVGDVVEWAKKQHARVQPRFVEALHQSLVADTKGLSSVGRDAVDELKKKVRDQLYERLERQVRAKCEEFVKKRKDEGPGVKRRILELFHEELAEDITKIAQPIATKVLIGNYSEVQAEISERLEAYKNPLQLAQDAIVASHADSAERRDARRRGRVLDQLDAIMESMPRLRS